MLCFIWFVKCLYADSINVSPLHVTGITPPVMTAEVASAPPAFDVNNVSGYEGTTIGDGKFGVDVISYIGC